MDKKMSQKFKCDFCKSQSYRENSQAAHRLGLSSIKFKIVECDNCGLTTLFPFPTKQELSEFYQNYATKKNRIHDELSRMEKIYPTKLNTLGRLTKGTKMLDIGAGLGAFCHMAREQGLEVTGVELSQEQCRYARDHFNLNLINQDIFSMGKDLGVFDIIHLHHVIEHLTSPDKCFEKIQHMLKPNGILLIEVPHQLPRIQEKINGAKPANIVFDFDHLFFFTPRTMKRYLCKHRFEIKAFNQHRPISWHPVGLPLQAVRYLFRKITSASYLPSGTFLEFYCKKK